MPQHLRECFVGDGTVVRMAGDPAWAQHGSPLGWARWAIRRAAGLVWMPSEIMP